MKKGFVKDLAFKRVCRCYYHSSWFWGQKTGIVINGKPRYGKDKRYRQFCKAVRMKG